MSMSDNPKGGIYVYAASVSGANDDLLLTDEAVNRLTGCSSSTSRVTAVSEGGVEGKNPTAVVMDDETAVLSDANSDDVENSVSSDCNDSEVLNDIHTSSVDDVCMYDERAVLIAEQKNDPSLSGCRKLAEKLRRGFMVKGGVLYKRERWYGQEFQQLVVPSTRKKHILTMGHDTVGGHMSAKRTEQRISLSFWWPGLAKECTEYVQTCTVCQKKAHITYRDRVPIKAIPRADRIFDHWFVDCVRYQLSLDTSPH